jgi:hypothetical protein
MPDIVTYMRPAYDACGNVIGWVRAQGPRAFVDGLRHVTRRAAHGCSGIPPWLLRGAVGGGLMGGVPTAHVEPPAPEPVASAPAPTVFVGGGPVTVGQPINGSSVWFTGPINVIGYGNDVGRYRHVDAHMPVVPPTTLISDTPEDTAPVGNAVLPLTPTPVPEPAGLAVLGVGIVALRIVGRKRR